MPLSSRSALSSARPPAAAYLGPRLTRELTPPSLSGTDLGSNRELQHRAGDPSHGARVAGGLRPRCRLVLSPAPSTLCVQPQR
ncbi:unnamed protein product [Rangifer tarandus platyrhynchus]|uniref:Uncharacterized protein n=1 Tax=Rangifer tarandus platyrhynchus TaxID=3082113 RepID=A0AC59YQN3_RANTA